MRATGKSPHRRGSKKSNDIKVGIMNGKPSIQVNWGGRIYGAPLSLLGSGGIKDSMDVSDIRATGNITFSKNSSVYNNSNRLLMVGGLNISGDENIAIGNHNVLKSSLAAADKNVVVGMDGLKNLTTGCANIVMGYRSGGMVTSAGSNVFIGTLTGTTSNDAVMTGSLNVVIGHEAGIETTGTISGDQNIAIGRLSGSLKGCDNIGIGYRAGIIVTGEDNIAIGKDAGDAVTSGDSNIAIGTGADNAATLDNQIAIGNGTTTTAANTTAIGNTSTVSTTLVGGTLFIKEQASAYTDVAAHGQLWIKNTTPCELWFTDDAGTDTKIA